MYFQWCSVLRCRSIGIAQALETCCGLMFFYSALEQPLRQCESFQVDLFSGSEQYKGSIKARERKALTESQGSLRNSHEITPASTEARNHNPNLQCGIFLQSTDPSLTHQVVIQDTYFGTGPYLTCF